MTATDKEFATCARLLANAHPENTQVTTNNLSALLAATYYEPLAPPAQSTRPLFHLFGYITDTVTGTNLVVAFYKTIKRQPPNVPTGPAPGGSTPTRRWWCISVGCAQQPATGWSYPLVKAISTWFYNNIKQPYEQMVAVDDYSRMQDPNRYDPNMWEVDADNALMTNDSTIKLVNPVTLQPGQQDVEPSYPPFTACLKVVPGAPLVFTGLSL